MNVSERKTPPFRAEIYIIFKQPHSGLVELLDRYVVVL
jgi:hypothetical protein